MLEITTSADGSLVIRPHGEIGVDTAVDLRQILVHAVRRTRPLRLIVDLAAVTTVDPINIGTFAAACGLADDHRVAVFFDDPPADLAARLTQAGVPASRLRETGRSVPFPDSGHPRTTSMTP